MSPVADAVKPLFDKLFDLFDIFDLSFFVSGATFVGAITWAQLTPNLEVLLGYGAELPAGNTLGNELPGVGVIVLIVASYISGMTCFAAGRFCRQWVSRGLAAVGRRSKGRKSVLLSELARHGVIVAMPSAGEQSAERWTVTEHGRKLEWLPRYFAGGKAQEAALYVRMWAEIRQREVYAPSFALLRRYWVSAATLDGLFVALATWGVLLAVVNQDLHGWGPSLMTLIGALFCMREAARYGDYQREEIVASVMLVYDLSTMEVAKASTPPSAGPAAPVSFAADAPAHRIASTTISAPPKP